MTEAVGRHASLRNKKQSPDQPYIKIVRRGVETPHRSRGTHSNKSRRHSPPLSSVPPLGGDVPLANLWTADEGRVIQASASCHRSVSSPSTLEKPLVRNSPGAPAYKMAGESQRNGRLASPHARAYPDDMRRHKGLDREETTDGRGRGAVVGSGKGSDRSVRGSTKGHERAAARSCSVPAILQSDHSYQGTAAYASVQKQGKSLSPRVKQMDSKASPRGKNPSRKTDSLLPREKHSSYRVEKETQRRASSTSQGTHRRICTRNSRNGRSQPSRAVETGFSPSEQRRRPSTPRSHCYACGNHGMREENAERHRRLSTPHGSSSSRTRSPSCSSPRSSSPLNHHSTRLDGCLACSPAARRRRHEGKSDREIVTTPSGVRTAEAKAEREAVIEARRKYLERLQSESHQQQYPSSHSSSASLELSFPTPLSQTAAYLLNMPHTAEARKPHHTFGYQHPTGDSHEFKTSLFQTDQHISCLLSEREKEEVFREKRHQKSSSLPRSLSYLKRHPNLATQKNPPSALAYQDAGTELRKAALRNSSSLSPAGRNLRNPHVHMSLASLSLHPRRKRPAGGGSLSPRGNLGSGERGTDEKKTMEPKDRQKKVQGVSRGGRQTSEGEASKASMKSRGIERSKDYLLDNQTKLTPRGKSPGSRAQTQPVGKREKRDMSEAREGRETSPTLRHTTIPSPETRKNDLHTQKRAKETQDFRWQTLHLRQV